jgi:high frequency lysogenization protein
MNPIEERTIALAGVIQACQQVQKLAREGFADHVDFDSSLQSVLVLDAMSTPAVFGGVQGIRSGLQTLSHGLLKSPQASDIELLRYVMSILNLQSQLYRDEQKFSDFANSVERLSAFDKDNLVDACSEVYQEFVSVMRPQIIVQGEQEHLQKEDVPPKIRTMLLAAMRSAVLWQQKGGGKFRMIWEQTRMTHAASNLLSKGLH